MNVETQHIKTCRTQQKLSCCCCCCCCQVYSNTGLPLKVKKKKILNKQSNLKPKGSRKKQNPK